MTTEILIIFLLILINGIFSLSEISIVSSKKNRLDAAAKKGSKGAKTALELANNPGKFLSTVQVGITLVGILTGFFSGGEISGNLAALLQAVGFSAELSESIAVVIVVMFITFFSIVIGELVPKRIGLTNAEKLAGFLSIPMKIISKVTAPLVWLLEKSTNLLMSIFMKDNGNEEEVTEEDVRSLIAQGASAGTFNRLEKGLVDRVFHFSDRKVASLMESRVDAEALYVDETHDENMRIMRESDYMELILLDGSWDKVVGVVRVRDFFFSGGKPEDLPACATKPLYLPANMSVLRALDRLDKANQRLALVVNEYGELQGQLRTEAIFGSFLHDFEDPRGAEDLNIQKVSDTDFLVDGLLPAAEFLTYFNKPDDLAQTGDFHTVAGLFLYLNKKIPEQGDEVAFDSATTLIAEEVTGQRIEKLRIRLLPSTN